MIFNNYTLAGITTGGSEQILEVNIPSPNIANQHAYELFQPATVELKVTGSNNAIIQFITSNEDTGSNLQNGMILDAGEKYVLDFNLGLYKIIVKSATGTTTLRINAMYYIRCGGTKI